MKRARVSYVECCVKCGGDFGARTMAQKMYCLPCAFEVVKISQKASGKVRRSVLRGEIPPASSLKCTDCGVQAKLYDHRSYEPPVIEPVCHSCNIRRGPAEFSRVA